MRTLSRLLLAGVAVLAVSDLASAQPRQRPGQGGFGAGGMGGGMGPTALISNPAVQEEIKITDDQKSKLTEWSREAGGRMREKLQSATQDVPREERIQKMQEVMAELNTEIYKELGEVLKPEQITRVKQISVQQAGFGAFRMPEVAEKLKLSDEQKEQISEISQKVQTDSREAMRGAFTGGGRPDAEAMAAIREKTEAVTKEAWTKVNGVLNSDQQKTWKELTGEPFDVSQLRGRVAGGPGGGRPGTGTRPGGNRPPRNID